MSDGTCSQFVLHAWKASVCANCLRPRSKHHTDHADPPVIPVHSRSTSSADAASKHTGVHTSEAAVTHLSHVGLNKQSPGKVKPPISAKPEKPRKPSLTGDQVTVKSQIKQPDDHFCGEHLTPSESKSSVPNNSANAQVTEKEFKSSVEVSSVAYTTDTSITAEKATDSNEKTFHHYDLYDVTARGLSGTPGEADKVDMSTAGEAINDGRRREFEDRKFQSLPTSAVRVNEVAEAHVAMPYNVVDVTLPRPRASNITSGMSDEVPMGSSSTVAAVSTWPTKPQPANRQVISKSPPKPRERLTKTKQESASSQNMEASSHHDLAKMTADAVEVATSDLVSERYAHRIYEEIDDLAVDQTDTDLIRQTAARSSIGKSPAFEAKMAALASLNLGKAGKPVVAAPQPVNLPEESAADETNVASSVQDSAVVPAVKPEKTRKSGGKTFFQMLLKFGSKDTSEASQSSTSNSSSDSSSKVIECPNSPSGKTNICDEDRSSMSDAVSTRAAPLTEKQAMLMSLKDCLAKRQASVGNESSELSPVPAKIQSSEPSLLRSSTQSSGSVQQAVSISKEKSREHGIVASETSPFADNQASGPLIQGQMSPNDVSMSAPQPTTRDLPDTDKGLQRMDKKGHEMQQLAVKDLSVVTEDGSNADCSVSTCSSDAVSPAPSDLSVEGSDHHSLKRKSRTDRQGITMFLL